MAESKRSLIITVLCSVFVVTLTQTPSGTGCSPNFVAHGDSCYHVSEIETTWAGAMGYCEAVGGRLAVVDSPDKQLFLQSYIQSKYKERTVNISTDGSYKYQYLIDYGINVKGHTSIVFNVMACHDAHVALSKDKIDTQNTYEIVIGGWSDSQSVIRDCKQCAHMDTAASQPHPLSCTDYRPFWVSWTNNIIRVGFGNDIGKRQFMMWNDTSPHDVNFVGIATGFGAQFGNWQFTRGTYMPGLFWMSGSDLAVEQEWKWLPSGNFFDYTNWATGQPDNLLMKEHCVAMDIHKSYHWADENCEERRNFICQTEKNTV